MYGINKVFSSSKKLLILVIMITILANKILLPIYMFSRWKAMSLFVRTRLLHEGFQVRLAVFLSFFLFIY